MASRTDPSRRRRARRVAAVAAAVLVVVLIAALGPVGYGISRVPRAPLLPSMANPPYRTPPGAPTPVTFVVVGTDHRVPEDPTGSVIMLAQLNGARNQAFLVGLPRQLPLRTEAGIERLSNTLGTRGVPGVVAGLRATLDTPIDHAVTVDLPTFVSLASDLGGITVDNPVAIDDPAMALSWPKGRLTLSGSDALLYVSIADAADTRAVRQQLVVRAILAKLLSREAFANPTVLVRAADTLERAVTLDSSLDTAAVVGLATGLRLRGTDAIHQGVLLINSEAAARSFADAVATDRLAEYAEAHPEQIPR